VLNCNIPNLSPEQNVRWEKDGQLFTTTSPRVKFLNNNQKIVFNTVKQEDAGSYICTTNDGSGMTYSTGINVFDRGKKT
jgi:beta-glucanase (GH16 family)